MSDGQPGPYAGDPEEDDAKEQRDDGHHARGPLLYRTGGSKRLRLLRVAAHRAKKRKSCAITDELDVKLKPASSQQRAKRTRGAGGTDAESKTDKGFQSEWRSGGGSLSSKKQSDP